MKFQWRLSLTAILLSTIISGCSVQTTSKPTLSNTEQQRNRAGVLLQKAENAKPIKSAELRAEAAQILLSLGQKENAYNVLDSIDISLLPPSMRFNIAKLKAEAAIEQNQPEAALEHLSALQANSQTGLPKDQEIIFLELQAQAYKQQKALFAEVKSLTKLSLILESNQAKQTIHDEIWNRLLMLDPTTRTTLLRQGNNSYYEQGWLELINELSNNKQLDTQHQAISNWATLWEAHPARTLPPSALNGLSKQSYSANKIAVLLPLEGKFAKAAAAIKEGILMAHFRQQQPGKQSPELLFLNSEVINTPIQLQAILSEQKVDLVIGPLSKDYVTTLAVDSHISTPILALNYADDQNREGLYQFGLSTDDEAKQIAEKAWSDGVRNAAILTPNSKWGEKVETTFREHFTALGGNIATSHNFGATEGFSADIGTFLGTDISKERYKKVRQAIYTRKIEFEEHRRQDIDAIILTALPNDARQLTPILAFNFAGDLPIYATSHLFSGTNDPIQDQDLNRIKFLGTPWSLKPPSQNKVLISQQRTDTNSRFGRLYALGLDAYRIYPYLQQLSALPGTEIDGETGKLSISPNGKVNRKLVWAEYKEGTPQLFE